MTGVTLPVELEITSASEHWVYSLRKDRVLVGNGHEADLVLRDASVSQRHAQLSRVEDGLRVLDLGSQEGTFVNGERVGSAPIEPGDVIRLGAVEVTFAGAERKPQPTPSVPAAPGPASRRRLLLGLAGSVALAALALVAFVLAGHLSVAGKPSKTTASAAAELMSACLGASDVEEPDFDARRCLEVCSRLRELGPAVAGFEKKTCEMALQTCEIALVGESHIAAIETSLAKGDYRDAIVAVSGALAWHRASHRQEKRLLRALDKAESADFVRENPELDRLAALKAIQKTYPEPRMRDLVGRYYEGTAPSALAGEFRRLLPSLSTDDRKTAVSLLQDLEILQRKEEAPNVPPDCSEALITLQVVRAAEARILGSQEQTAVSRRIGLRYLKALAATARQQLIRERDTLD